jgi:hypothetical protein
MGCIFLLHLPRAALRLNSALFWFSRHIRWTKSSPYFLERPWVVRSQLQVLAQLVIEGKQAFVYREPRAIVFVFSCFHQCVVPTVTNR